MHTTVSIPGMHCDSCAQLIQDVSSEFSEIKNVQVDLSTKKVVLEYEDGFDQAKWKTEIETLGDAYKVHPVSS